MVRTPDFESVRWWFESTAPNQDSISAAAGYPPVVSLNSDHADGYVETILPGVGSTIRPDESAATLAGPQSEPRELPSLSVDLRTSDVPTERAAATDADLELVEVIGEGGMGRVFLARQHSLARDVAVKTPLDGSGPAISAALVAEGRITGQLEHPAIVPVHVLGLDKQGRPAMVMKRIEGVEWERLARDPNHPGWAGWPGSAEDRTPGHLQIFIAICNAVHFAHSRGIIHRASWLRWMAICMAASYVACNVWPEHALTWFGVLSALALFIAAGFQWAESRRVADA
jgi:hypothetical protein